MKSGIIGLLLGVATFFACASSHSPGQGRESAAQSGQADDEGWVDLMPGPDLKGWKRVPIAPDTKPNARNPWKMDAAGKVLQCDGVDIKEMLLYDTEFKDGTFHVEWRFKKVPDKTDYNSGVYVRTAADGKVWHQSQVAHLDKAPRLGDLFGETFVDGKLQKFLVEGKGTKLARPPGEWNTYDITCQGPKVSVSVNGTVATTWNDCRVAKGHVGLQAEFFYIEFKNVKFKVAAAIGGVLKSAAKSQRAKPQRLLILSGIPETHHDYKSQCPNMRKVLKEQGHEVTLRERAIVSEEDAGKFDVIVLMSEKWRGDEKSRQQLLHMVRDGMGLVAIHMAYVPCVEALGGKAHRNGKTGNIKIEIVDRRHPITEGVDDFTAGPKDELYAGVKLTAKDVHVLAKGQDTLGDWEPVAWVRTHGKGSVFYISLGHSTEGQQNPGFLQLVTRAVRWAGNKERP